MLNSEMRKKFIEWNSEMNMKYKWIFSIVVIEKANMDKRRDVFPFYKCIREEGIVLWSAI